MNTKDIPTANYSSRFILLAACLFLALAASMLVAPAAHAADFTVTKTADTNDGACDSDCSLREAVVAANATAGADTINIPAGTYTLTRTGSDNTSAVGDLDIAGSTNFVGAGAGQTIIDGNATDRVLDVFPSSASTVNISGVTIRNGAATFAAGIFTAGNVTMNISDSVISANKAGTSGGGGIDNRGNLTIEDSEIFGNTSEGVGAGIDQTGGSLTITGSTLSGNEALSTGGAIFNQNGQVSITRSTLSGNSAEHGGAIRSYTAQSKSLTITESTISDNRAFDTAGGTAGDFGDGGGIFAVTDGGVEIIRSTFSGNTAARNGGGVFFRDSFDSTFFAEIGSLTMTNSTLSGNKANRNGGGLAVAPGANSPNPNDGTATLNFSTITGNTADDNSNGGDGGGVSRTGGTLNTKNSIIAGNTDKSGQPPDCSGTVVSQGNNLLGGGCPTGGSNDATVSNINNVLNTTLAENGGPTRTHALVAGSSAIDNGDSSGAPGVDQRNVVRPQPDGGAVDIGSFELEQAACPPDGIIFVDASATGNNDGFSWDDAFTSLQNGLAFARSGDCADTDQIWVADGTYTPDIGSEQTENDRDPSFDLISGVEVYGGFAGGEAAGFDLDDRGFGANETILSGDLAGNDQSNPSNFAGHGENSFHVVVGSGTNSTALLDGFTVKGGNADGSGGGNNAGGGMYNDAGSPAVRNVTFISNRTGNFTGNPGSGGGMANSNGSSPTITNAVFTNNFSSGSGGGMNNFESGPTVANTVFRNNQANGGGGVSDSFGGSTIVNAVFTGNITSSGGGLRSFRNKTTPTTIVNSTFSGNTASSGQGGGIFSGFDGLTVVRNSILWNTGAAITSINGGASTVTNSTVQGGFPGDGNSSRDPRFANDLRLQTNSPAVNAGDNDFLPADSQDLDGDGNTTEKIPFDLAGENRIFQNTNAALRIVDMGAYELQAEPTNAAPTVANPIPNQNLEVGGPDFTTNLTNVFSDADDDPLTFTVESSDTDIATASVSGSTLTVSPVAEGGATITVTANDGRGGSVPDVFEANVAVRPTCSDEGIIYVDEDAEAGGLGTSWDDAFTDLQDALALARSGECADADQIWVADGTYIPTDGTDRNSTFTLVEGIETYGGFEGDEAPDFDLDGRDFDANRTVLSGDIDGNDTTDEDGVVRNTANIAGGNSYNVVTAFEVDGTAVLDGFTVTGGRANGGSCLFLELGSTDCGAGMEVLYASPALRNLEFVGNFAQIRGGGMIISTDSSPSLTNVRFESNTAEESGGGAQKTNPGNPTFTNVAFVGNSTTDSGGGMFVNSQTSEISFDNVLFSGNRAGLRGGGIAASAQSVSFTNATFSGNRTDGSGGGVVNFGPAMSFENSIVWNNAAQQNNEFQNGNGSITFSHSLVKGANPTGTGNLDGANPLNDPRFVAPVEPSEAPTTDGNYRLENTSRAINRGDNGFVAATTDLDGNARIFGAAVDLGAYEFQNESAGAAVSLAPDPLAFGDHRVGATSDAKTITATNTGNAPLDIESISSSDGQFDIEPDGTTCDTETPLAIDGTCEISVTFTPDSSGGKTATLSLATNASGSPQTAALSGTGTTPAANLEPASVDFGNQRVGTPSDPETATLSNTGNAPLDITSITTDDGQFSVESSGTTCDTEPPLAPDGTCEISITFTPGSVGGKTANLSVASDDPDSPDTVSLSGTGTAPEATLAPTSVDFGDQRVNTTGGPQNVTLSNTGTASLTVSDVSLSDGSAGFTISDNGCENDVLDPGASEVPGGSCVVEITFTPDSSGAKTANLIFGTDASGSPHSAALSGDGVEPVAGVSPEALDFGDQRVGTTSGPETVTLSNTGTAPLDVGSVAIDGGDGQFEVSSEDCVDGTVPVSGDCAISVTFAPDSVGGKSATLTVSDDAAGSPRVVPLAGDGVSPEAAVAPSAVGFGAQRVGTVGPVKGVTLTNTGTAEMAVESAAITGANVGQFRKSADACSNTVLAPSESCAVSLRFAPTSAGVKAASLEIRTDASAAPITASLRGTGAAPKPPPPNPNRCTIVGTPGNDRLVGTPGRDVICGLGGDDVIFGLGGNDVIRGGAGNDVIHGGSGNDTIIGGSGNDILRGNAGNDTLIGGPGNDILIGGPGRDRLNGGPGRNIVRQ